jgi:hypothetical protein
MLETWHPLYLAGTDSGALQRIGDYLRIAAMEID